MGGHEATCRNGAQEEDRGQSGKRGGGKGRTDKTLVEKKQKSIRATSSSRIPLRERNQPGNRARGGISQGIKSESRSLNTREVKAGDQQRVGRVHAPGKQEVSRGWKI